MAREILFKAQRADTKEWVEVYPVFDFADCSLKRRGKCACEHNRELLCFYGWIDELHEYDEIEVIPETVCQYTGLNDGTKWEELSEGEKEKFLSERNHKEDRLNTKEDWSGRKIFEGDIVRRKLFECFSVGQVVWFDIGFCGFYLKIRNSYYPIGKNEHTGKSDCDQVIGNIFDNPESLNQ